MWRKKLLTLLTLQLERHFLNLLTEKHFEATTKDTIAVNVNNKNIEKENSRLRERNLEVERDHALMIIEFEEIALKCKDLKISMTSLITKMLNICKKFLN